MSEKYYSIVPLEEGEIWYVFLDMEKSFDEIMRWTKEAPQSDGKTTEPYYLEPAEFWDKVSDKYIDLR